jgi:hypothetical protein
MSRSSVWCGHVLFVFVVMATPAAAEDPPARGLDQSFRQAEGIAGVYVGIAKSTILPGGRKDVGSPEQVLLTPSASEKITSVDLSRDPLKQCAPIGPFRMMALDALRFEFIPAKTFSDGVLFILFEDVAHGLLRQIHMGRSEHDYSRGARAEEEQKGLWLGDSIGHWEENSLVIDTVNFNDKVWLNNNGAHHSDALHLIERIRPILDGKYIEYRMTAEDPRAIAKPYTYIRYFAKSDYEIQEDVCEYEEDR